MRKALLLLSFLALPAVAHAQCVAVPGGPDTTVLSCPSGTSLLHTDANGVVTGQVGGQVFVGQQAAPGVIDGRLGADPYAIIGGRAAEPPTLPRPALGVGRPGVTKPPLLGRSRDPGALVVPPAGGPLPR